MSKKKKKNKRTKTQPATPDWIGMMGQKLMAPHETFRFECRRCGGCCQNVRDSVPLESIDIFRLVKHLRHSGYFAEGNMAAAISEIAVATEITGGGYFMLCMKTEQPQDKCIFLNGSSCDVQAAKPRACRIYPLSVYPNRKYTGLQLTIDRRDKRHFTGQEFYAGKWLDDCYDAEDKEYTLYEPKVAVAIEQRLRLLSGSTHLCLQARTTILEQKYCAFDLEKPFIPQYKENITTLLRMLDILVEQATGQRVTEV